MTTTGIFYLSEHLAPVFARKVEVKEDEVRQGHIGVPFVPAQKAHSLNPILDVVEVVADLAVLESLIRQTSIPLIVLHHKDLYGPCVSHAYPQFSFSNARKVK
jgi:hypothetical protein